MKNKEFMNKVTRSLGKAKLKVKKNSPEILVVAGILGTIAGTVMACKATTKVESITKETKKTVDLIHKGMEKGKINGVEYTEDDGRKDLTITYTQTAMKLIKLYGPSALVMLASISSIVASHKILSKRNVAIAAAYTAVDKGFKEYRGRVVERFGEEIDKELKYNIQKKEVTETVVDENGNETTVTKTVDVVDKNATEYSVYARCYDDGCIGWSKDPEANLTFLKLQQCHANDKLRAQGYLFLNDIYGMLGIPKTAAGQVVGWIYDEDNPIGDNYVDFGIYNLSDESCRRFVNGLERSIWLDFNPDGNILDML